jgi:hypothetical protein
VHAFFQPGSAPQTSEARNRYNSLYYFWSGDWQGSNMLLDPRIQASNVYANTRQLWRNASAIVDLYTHFVYAGDLSTDGKPLPDGTRGAIPIDPQVTNQSDKDNLTAALAAWWTAVNLRQFISLRPKFGSMLGDVLTEIVDDRAVGMPRPQLIWPGYVTHLELDLAHNVKAVSYEYQVTSPASNLFGKQQEAESYLFRKDIDGDFYYYYRDNVLTRQVPNPYGFVPCIWDRHEIVFGDRGLGAIDRTFQQAVELNSMLSHAMDYQQKQFGAPIGVKGTSLGNRNSQLKMNNRVSTGDPLHDAAMVAQSLGLLPFSDNGDFITVDFDIGKTPEMLKLVMDSILAENPEARYSQQILEMTQVTAPGVERALGPIIGRVKDARRNYDTQTIKMLQMSLAIAGWRIQSGGYDPALIASRPDRYQPLSRFNLESYGRGMLDFTIPDREVIPDTIDERIARRQIVETLQWEDSLRLAGVDERVITEVVGQREEDRQRTVALEEIAAVGQPREQDEDREDEE